MAESSVAQPALPATSRLRRVAPFLLLGPISGPLIAGVLINLRAGRPMRATLYGVALAEASFLLPYIAGRLGLHYF